MKFKRIDIEQWHRKEFYNHFMQEFVCTYSITVNIDITPLQGKRLYPAMLWLLTDTVNEMEEFRTALTPEGLGIYDELTPSYTIFNRENKNFSAIYTPFHRDYNTFLKAYEKDVETYSTSVHYAAKPGRPANSFDVSMLPWASFTSFNINTFGSADHLLPIFTMGKAFEQASKKMLPMAIQVHHAVCDGYHIGQFVDSLQSKIDQFGCNHQV